MVTRDSPGSNPSVAIAAIARGEDDYVAEWVAFNLAVGADHVFIADHGVSPSLHRELGGFVKAGLVTVFRFKGRNKPQREAYERFLRLLTGKFRWVGFLDIDEFVFPVEEDSLKAVLREYDSEVGLAVHWVTYGSGGLMKRSSAWVTETFTTRGKLEHQARIEMFRRDDGFVPVNAHVKCFVNPSETIAFRSAHHYKFRNGASAVNENYRPVSGPIDTEISVKKIRINHYWSKSLEELIEKILKGKVSGSNRGESKHYNVGDALTRDIAASGEHDDSILRFLDKAQQIFSAHEGEVEFGAPPVGPYLRYDVAGWLQMAMRRAAVRYRRLSRMLRS